MKYFFFLLLIVAGALAYVRYQQPKTWNDYVDALKVAEPADANGAATPSKPASPEIISNSVLMNPDHTRPVDEPSHNPPPANPPSTNAAPATSP